MDPWAIENHMRGDMKPSLQRLPVDLSTFAELRQEKYLYVDKTRYAYDLIAGGRRFFLSRPRRFGKTLFISTLREILLGNKHLFEGLWIHSGDYTWNKYAVISLDLSAWGITNAQELSEGLRQALLEVAQEYSIEIVDSTAKPELLLRSLVKALRIKYGRVALLIDEYDSPILHSLKEQKNVIEIRDDIRSFFASIKGLDAEINFVFITGVSSFAKAGIFSGLNNLQIISQDVEFAGICGYTEQEMHHYFTPYIQAWAAKDNLSSHKLTDEIKRWYNGYRFSKRDITVYAPFSVMNALYKQEFINYWIKSGTPSFLIEELEKEYRKTEYRLLRPEDFRTSLDSLGTFDVGKIPLTSLMFQTGYMTIRSYDPATQVYSLWYPNYEVETALQAYMFASLARLDDKEVSQAAAQLKYALNEARIAEAIEILHRLFMHIPYQLQIKEEKYYHALLQMACGAAGIKTRAEHAISHGRIDLILDLPNWLYVIEIKFNKSADEALSQIESMNYHEPFISDGKPIILLGLSFHRKPKAFGITYKEKILA